MTYIIPVNPEAKAHKLNNIGKPMCGAKLAPGSTKSDELGEYKLCRNCHMKEQGVGFGRSPVSVNAVNMRA